MHIYTQAYREVRCFVGKLLEEGCLKLWPDGDNEEEKMGRFVWLLNKITCGLQMF